MDYETPDMLVRLQDGVTIVRFRNALMTGLVDIHRMTAAINGIIDDGARRLVLDFKNVAQAGSAALGMMISVQKRLKELGGKLGLSHPEHIQDLLDVSHTARLFELFPDTKAAFKKLKL